ncbi:MAG: hypothetical protein K9M55_04205 [Candidatus Marinimicrobia bacterium]|nr:hypothetical protein [Candidatus Neomarinimicrobiota bacterium]
MRFLILFALLMLTISAYSQDTDEIDIDLECSTCHVGNDWSDDVGRTFDHITTGFELIGTHADLNCSLCHTGTTPKEKHDFGRVSSDCNTCHEDIHSDLWGSDCERCHNPESWSLSTQQQNHDLTNFPLRGAHRNLDCSDCHVSSPGQSSTLALNCAGCHIDNYNRSVNPSHVTLALDTDCEICHSNQSTRWTDTFFNHNNTSFPLIGMHATATCATCHAGPAQGSPSECQSCHEADYASSTEPAHAVAGYPMECSDCHDSFTWNSNFIHDQTGFILQGAHIETLCSQCHENQNFAGTAQECAGCHLNAWETGETFSHEAAEFALTCEDCHDAVAWVPSTWSHDIDTDYPLTGAHVEVTCLECHLSSPYSEQSSECYACHQATYEATRDPNHVNASIPTTCGVCHTTDNWESINIDHSLTAFPLMGAHADVECAVCHNDGYDLPTDCQGCHLQDYTSTSTTPSPDHTQYGFSKDCLICHSQVSWKPSAFDHDPNLTGFEIRGAHVNLLPNDCYACHETATWSGLSSDCSGCHQSTFDNTSDPDHETNGFPVNLCETCHSQDAWEPSIFTHESNTMSCVTCHLVQYNGTTEPDHEALSFPTDCASCHTMTAWEPASFDHDAQNFPIYSGQHRNQWDVCSDCHTNSNNYADFTCIRAGCHSVADLNGEHFDDGSYVSCNGITYSPAVTSNDCFTCHPTGDEDDCEGDLFNNRYRTFPFEKESGPNEIN